MLLDYLDKVREKPRAARKRFAFFMAVGFTALIAIAWGFTLPARFAALNVSGENMVGSAGMEELGGELKDSKSGLQEMIDSGKEFTQTMSPQMQQQFQAQGFIQGGQGQITGTSTEPTSTSTASSTAPSQPPQVRPVMIATSSTATTSTAATDY